MKCFKQVEFLHHDGGSINKVVHINCSMEISGDYLFIKTNNTLKDETTSEYILEVITKVYSLKNIQTFKTFEISY